VRNIVSEALTNIRRHASASKVRVDVKISGNEMAIEINDNGRGLGRSPDELPAYVAEGRLGIAGMKERVELLGGRFSLDSDSTGTRISFHVPVSQVSSKEKQAADEPDNDSHSR
jgi:signal transduction histidine kinase